MKNQEKKYRSLISLSKEMMKLGNISEYYKLLNEVLIIKRQLIKS